MRSLDQITPIEHQQNESIELQPITGEKFKKLKNKVHDEHVFPTMKFSHSLQFNSVSDWADHYINYSNAKKLIYQIEKEQVTGKLSDSVYRDNEEEEALIGGDHDESAVNALFRRFLDKELSRIASFYNFKESELYRELESLKSDIQDVEENGYIYWAGLDVQTDPRFPFFGMPGRKRKSSLSNQARRDLRAKRRLSVSTEEGGDSEDELQHSNMLASRSTFDDVPEGNVRESFHSENPDSRRLGGHQSWIDDIGYPQRQRPQNGSVWSDPQEYAIDTRIHFKRRIIGIYVKLSELRSFVTLNETGFSKALKKYDKIVGECLKEVYLETRVRKEHPFEESTKFRLRNAIENVEILYAKVVTNDDIDVAKKELKSQLREHVVLERNTIWRDMISQERRSQGLELMQAENGDKGKAISTVVGTVTVTTTFARTLVTLIMTLVIFAILLNVKIFEDVEEQNCLAMLVFVSLLWATEVIPLFATSLLVPALVVGLRVLRTDDGMYRRLSAPEATKFVFSTMFSPVIMLLLGGFAIAGALSKYHIAKLVATWVLSKAGNRPAHVLLANMFVAAFASMWISNVAAPVLCFSLIQPILRTLPNDSPFAKCLILGIALASNVGGMASPIASPQNIIALQNMDPTPTWLEWFFISLPICTLSLISIWVVLIIAYRPGKSTTIHTIRHGKEVFTPTQWYITIVTLITVGLWCVEKSLEPYFGDMGVIAVFPLLAFFGTGILTKEDFNNFLWTVIVLAMGGIALGKAVQSSGLLHSIAEGLQKDVVGLSLQQILIVFALLTLVMATFISHTVAAVIIIPIVAQVGAALEDPHPRLLIMGAALCCSAAMGLPVSGFPNMNAIMLENELGQRYLGVGDFLKFGILSSLLTFVIIINLGYGLMHLVGL